MLLNRVHPVIFMHCTTKISQCELVLKMINHLIFSRREVLMHTLSLLLGRMNVRFPNAHEKILVINHYLNHAHYEIKNENLSPNK